MTIPVTARISRALVFDRKSFGNEYVWQSLSSFRIEYLHSSSFWMHPFECVAMEEDGKQLPWWTKNEGQPELMAQVQKAIDDGRSYNELCARLMLLRF